MLVILDCLFSAHYLSPIRLCFHGIEKEQFKFLASHWSRTNLCDSVLWKRSFHQSGNIVSCIAQVLQPHGHLQPVTQIQYFVRQPCSSIHCMVVAELGRCTTATTTTSTGTCLGQDTRTRGVSYRIGLARKPKDGRCRQNDRMSVRYHVMVHVVVSAVACYDLRGNGITHSVCQVDLSVDSERCKAKEVLIRNDASHGVEWSGNGKTCTG
jgi:hypothetical protein